MPGPVSDVDAADVVQLADAHLDAPAVRCELQRVAHEVGEHDLQPVRIPEHHQLAGVSLELQRHAARLRGRTRHLDDARRDIVQIELRDVQAQPADVEPSEIQQVVDQTQQAVGVAPDHEQRGTQVRGGIAAE